MTVLLRLCCYSFSKVAAGTAAVALAPRTILVTEAQLLAPGPSLFLLPLDACWPSAEFLLLSVVGQCLQQQLSFNYSAHLRRQQQVKPCYTVHYFFQIMGAWEFYSWFSVLVYCVWDWVF